MTEPNVSPELPSVTWRALLELMRRVPQASLSRGVGRLADVPLPRPLRRTVILSFARAVGVRLSEVEKPLEEYSSVNAFFVRRLKAGTRTWPINPDCVGSPVDGIVGAVGDIRDGTAVQAKGRRYSVAALLEDSAEASAYEGGRFATLYLSPRHYHRVHAPVGGTIPFARHVAGRLFPVNAPSVAHIPDLFARNERMLCRIDSAIGRVTVVAVGAFNVARISTAFDPEWSGPRAWVSNRRETPVPERRYDPPLAIERGVELMTFHLGSTVILLLPPGTPPLRPFCRPGREVLLGEPLVHMT